MAVSNTALSDLINSLRNENAQLKRDIAKVQKDIEKRDAIIYRLYNAAGDMQQMYLSIVEDYKVDSDKLMATIKDHAIKRIIGEEHAKEFEKKYPTLKAAATAIRRGSGK